MHRYVLFFALLILCGCELTGPDATQGSPDVKFGGNLRLIVGTWSWHSSIVYFTGGEPITTTPQEAGYTETVKFTDDGIVEIHEGDELLVRSSYTVSRLNSEASPLLQIEGWGSAELGVNRNWLLISTAAADGPAKYYRRVD